MGPLLAMHGVLKRTNLKLDDMDLIDVNEAFAAQAMAVLKACAEVKYSSRWGIDEALGEVDIAKFNVNGGAIALGHPVGSTGSRLVVTQAHELKRRGGKYAIASLCIGGGQGGAVIIENLK
jgi:acetyl-CoA C-acetyltransferase/acetyl-CoA acyltransferase